MIYIIPGKMFQCFYSIDNLDASLYVELIVKVIINQFQ